MNDKIEEQYEELCKIEDIDERIQTACERFNTENLSAKALRWLYDTLDVRQKIIMVDKLYSKEYRKNNMRRLPPKILIPNSDIVDSKDKFELYSNLIKYELINQYNLSKVQNKFQKMQKVLKNCSQNISFRVLDPSAHVADFQRKAEIDSMAINGFFEDLMESEKQEDLAPLDLPKNMTVGVEIEFMGVEFLELQDFIWGYGIDYFDEFEIKPDLSLCLNNVYGSEITSPVLSDTKESWEKLQKVCAFIKMLGGKANKKCGGHVHIGANILGVDKKAWEIFEAVWAEVEPLMYMISNRKGERTRASIKRFGMMIGPDIRNQDWDTIELHDESDLPELADNVHSGIHDRYRSMNLTNLANPNKTTIEFRISNGTVDYNIWRENVLLYGRLLQMAKLASLEYSIKEEKLEKFFEIGLTEKEKLERFLDLIFDKEEEKQIFYKRWESRSGENPIFGESSITTYKRQKTNERKNEKRKKEYNDYTY